MNREQFKLILKVIGKKQKEICADLNISSTAVSKWHTTGAYPKYFFYYLSNFKKDREITQLKEALREGLEVKIKEAIQSKE